MPKVAFHTLGCKVNQYETEAITEQFLSKGYDVVDFDEVADVYVVNTCTVTNVADKKSRKMLSKAKKMNEDSIVVAVGCYVQVAHDSLEDTSFIDVLIGNTHKNDVVTIVEDYTLTNSNNNLIENVQKDIKYEELHIEAQQSKSRSTIKIQDGCNQYCTYCIIPFTRGKIRSREPESVLSEVKALAIKGYHEIILTGIHLASYGKDLEGVELVDLIEQLDKIDGIKRIRIGSLEPNYINEKLLERLIACHSVCDHFHLSMQSGSDTVLSRMKRHYNSSDYFEKVRLIRKLYVNPAITTDVIVGFPMETEDEATETLEFIEKVKFSDLHIFKYSIREGTKAAEMKPQISGLIKTKRSKELNCLGRQMHSTYLSGFINEKAEVLLEDDIEINNSTYKTGYTSNYMKVYIKTNESPGNLSVKDNDRFMTGMLKEVVLIKLFKDGILGQKIEWLRFES